MDYNANNSQSLQTLNEVSRYRSNTRICESYIKETIKIRNQIGSLEQKIGYLENEIFDMKVEYKEQQLNDLLNVVSVFGQAAYNAKYESYDLYSFAFAMLSNLDPQTVVETIYGYSNSPRITYEDIKLLEKKNKKEIKLLKSEIRGLESELKSYEKEITRMKD